MKRHGQAKFTYPRTGKIPAVPFGVLEPQLATCATPLGQCQGRGMQSRPMIRTASMDAHGRPIKAMRIAKPG